MNQFVKLKSRKDVLDKLHVEHGHNTLTYVYDIEYIPRMIRKVSRSISLRRFDIDWVQNGIESFLILNSRFYDDLIIDFVKDVRKYQTLPNNFSVKTILKEYKDTLSYKYHDDAPNRRHRVAHGSSFNVVGIPQYKNQTLPKPLRFRPTEKPPLFNMSSRRNFIKNWANDMKQCADDIETITEAVVAELNKYENLPPTSILEGSGLRNGKNTDDFINELKVMDKRYSKMKKMKKMSDAEVLAIQISHFETIEKLHNEYFEDS